jgi:putative endonuclease
MSFVTYILYSSKLDKYYVGSTENIEERLKKHNLGNSTFTSRGTPWVLVYQEVFETRSQSLVREREIKNKKSRKYIEFLIGPIAHSVRATDS